MIILFRNIKKKKLALIISGVLLVSLIVIEILWTGPRKKSMPYIGFLSAVEGGRVDTVYLTDSADMKIKLKDGSVYYTDNPRSDNLKETLLKKGVKVDEAQFASAGEKALSLVFGLAFVAAIGFFATRGVGRRGGMSVRGVDCTAKSAEGEINIGFSDVAGNDEAKESVRDIVDFLKNPGKYSRYGARMPRGVIFYGPPGTGKTLLAKAVAGEAGVSFYALSGSDFVQVYVGVGAARVRSLFKKAAEKGRCVIFIDEIDALGKKREGGGFEGGNDEREQTLNALLSEMSGFNDRDGIVVIAATNRFDTLDEALLRPGRFDRHVEVGLPDVNGRYEILKIHANGKPLSDEVDLRRVAGMTVYFSGAMLENMMNEAAILAAKRNADSIESRDIDKAFSTVIAGAEKIDRSMITDAERKITAYHEAGHVLVSKLIAPEIRIPKVTIIPSTNGAAGYTMNIPPDSMYKTKRDMESDIMISLGGRAAEEMIFGSDNITTGASGDIEKATETVAAMVRIYGMDDSMGLLNYDALYRRGFHDQSMEIVSACRSKMNKLYESVKSIIAGNRDKLDRLAASLLIEETLDEDGIEKLIA